MSDELWFRFFPSKFMAGIRGLNANEVKVYISLLCRMYERGGPLKNDAEILATYCELRPSSFEPALARLIRLEKIFLTADGMLFNAAAEQEISRRESSSEIAKRAGKRSAEKRQENQAQQPTTVEPPINHLREEKRREEDTPLSPKGDQLELIPTEPKASRRKAPGRPFSEDWKPKETTILWAKARGLNDDKIRRLAEACQLHHMGRGTLFADHDRAFQKWVMTDETYEAGRPRAAPANSPVDGILRRIAAQGGAR